LRDRGVAAHLHVVGVAPASELATEGVTYHGILNKAVAVDGQKLRRLMQESAFLFLPTRQDCTPMVFAEGNAYGMPGISTATGGVASVVCEGRNGHLLPEGAGPSEYADLIEKVWSDAEGYVKLRCSSRRQYEQVLNWRQWAGQSAELIRSVR